ncbi:hypothetical protein BD408DRAFT_448273 [Parasitella parasitica]|nr:hypothetical protein BD408DRAFT_448273 [Parasitella parasitica]
MKSCKWSTFFNLPLLTLSSTFLKLLNRIEKNKEDQQDKDEQDAEEKDEEGDNISIESGESLSEATSRAAAANSHSTSDFGRRIDVLIHNCCYGIRSEYCCIEFKKQDAKTGLLTFQQSKNIRINGAILNDLIAKANAEDIYLIYMGFWGVLMDMSLA